MAVNSFREDEHIQATDAKKIVTRLLGYLKGYTKEVILVLVAMTITVGISLYNPILIESAIDDYVAKYDFNGLLRLAAFAVAINILYVIMVKIRIYGMSYIQQDYFIHTRGCIRTYSVPLLYVL